MHIIPIGSNCHVASALKTTGLRICSYPFDWIIIEDNFIRVVVEIMKMILSDEWEIFLDRFFDRDANQTVTQTYNNHVYFKNVEYNVGFPHDRLDGLKEKYKRRFKRLRDVILSQQPLTLVGAFRWEILDVELNDLLALVQRHNPFVNMVCVNGLTEPILPNIRLVQFPFPESFMDNKYIYDREIYGKALPYIFSNILHAKKIDF
jgi:hypothetical protein